MKTPMDLAILQKEYDAMVKVAQRSLDADVDLSPAFERELTSLMRVVKAMGGKVQVAVVTILLGGSSSVRTNKQLRILPDRVSYISTKYSDFVKYEIIQIFSCISITFW